MIEVIASGPVRVMDDQRIDKQSGHDRIKGTVTTTDTQRVCVDLEFPQGYVNLEGYAPSQVGWPLEEIFGRFTDLPHDAEFVHGEWTVEMRGDWWDWVQQSHRYQTERPHQSIIDCLEYFSGWDETDSDTLGTAIERVRGTAYCAAEMGDLSDQEWQQMTRELNKLLDNHRDGRFTDCQTSYSDD